MDPFLDSLAESMLKIGDLADVSSGSSWRYRTTTLAEGVEVDVPFPRTFIFDISLDQIVGMLFGVAEASAQSIADSLGSEDRVMWWAGPDWTGSLRDDIMVGAVRRLMSVQGWIFVGESRSVTAITPAWVFPPSSITMVDVRERMLRMSKRQIEVCNG